MDVERTSVTNTIVTTRERRNRKKIPREGDRRLYFGANLVRAKKSDTYPTERDILYSSS